MVKNIKSLKLSTKISAVIAIILIVSLSILVSISVFKSGSSIDSAIRALTLKIWLLIIQNQQMKYYQNYIQ